jgi:hypothetical protein
MLMATETPSNIPQRVRYVYEKPEGIKAEPIYINGVQGGMTGRGELVLNFFFEYMEPPSADVVPIKEGKLAFDKIQVITRGEVNKEEIVVRRDIRACLVIPVQQISSIANWMLDTLKASHITVEKGEK